MSDGRVEREGGTDPAPSTLVESTVSLCWGVADPVDRH